MLEAAEPNQNHTLLFRGEKKRSVLQKNWRAPSIDMAIYICMFPVIIGFLYIYVSLPRCPVLVVVISHIVTYRYFKVNIKHVFKNETFR